MAAFIQEPEANLIGIRMFVALIECIEYVVILNRSLGGGKRNIPRFTIMLIYTVIVVITGNMLGMPHIVKSVAVFSFLIIFSSFLYKVPAHLTAFFTLLVFHIFSMVAMVVGNMFAWIYGQDIVTLLDGNHIFVLHNAATLVLQVICITLAHKLLTGMVTDNPQRFWVMLNLTLAASYFLASLFSAVNPVLQVGYITPLVLLAIIVFMMINVCTIAIFNQLAKYYKKEKRAAVSGLQAESIRTEMACLLDSQKELRRFRHDWDNQVLAITLMISNGKVQEGIDTLRSISVPMPEISTKIYTGFAALDAVINLKVYRAQEKQVALKLFVSKIFTLDIAPVEITSVIANLLDNAIDAVENLPEESREIFFRCSKARDYLIISTKNRYIHKIVSANGEIGTSKTSPGDHGLGLRIVRDICVQYDGHLDVEYANGEFKAQAVIKVLGT